MKILGIHWGHDASFCLVIDGEIICHIELERISRKKQHNFKHNQESFKDYLEHFLKKNDVSLDEIDMVVMPKIFNMSKYPKKILEVFKNNDILYFDHHDLHAAASYYLSPYNEAVIFTLDGGGNDCGLGYYYGIDNKIKNIRKENDGAVGQVWSETRRFWSDSNQGPMSTEGVLMGASPYGQINEELVEYFLNHMKNGQKVYTFLYKEIEKMFNNKLFGLQKAKYHDDEETYFMFSASLQEAFERYIDIKMKELVKAIDKPIDNIVLAGGSFLNCVAIGKIVTKYFKNIFVPASLDDGSLSIGGALWYYHQVLNNPKSKEKSKVNSTPYLGFKYSYEDIEQVLIDYKDKIDIREASSRDVASLISDGNIIALYQGKSESGKRALGNRSILADPRYENMKDIINSKVKLRHWYRPFAPAILEEFQDEYFDMQYTSPYMSLALSVREEKIKNIPAACHIDNTARLQTVNRKDNELYYDILNSFYKITNIPVLINTSFNETEPIVDTPEDALKTFFKTKIDYLYINRKLISKKSV